MASISNVRLQIFENASSALIQVGYTRATLHDAQCTMHNAPCTMHRTSKRIASSCNGLATISAPAKMATAN